VVEEQVKLPLLFFRRGSLFILAAGSLITVSVIIFFKLYMNSPPASRFAGQALSASQRGVTMKEYIFEKI